MVTWVLLFNCVVGSLWCQNWWLVTISLQFNMGSDSESCSRKKKLRQKGMIGEQMLLSPRALSHTVLHGCHNHSWLEFLFLSLWQNSRLPDHLYNFTSHSTAGNSRSHDSSPDLSKTLDGSEWFSYSTYETPCLKKFMKLSLRQGVMLMPHSEVHSPLKYLLTILTWYQG